MAVETVLYDRLGLACDASPDQIRRSYRRAALVWHPDRNRNDPAAADNFKACLEAYEILSDPSKRVLYDAYGMRGVQGAAATDVPPPPQQQRPQWSQRPQRQQERHERQQQRQSRRQHSRRQPQPQTQPFEDDPFGLFDSFDPSRRASPSQSTHAFHTTASAAPSGFSFSTSFSFSSSGGSYTTHHHTWNSRDGHQTRTDRGTFGPDGERVSRQSGDRSSRHAAPPDMSVPVGDSLFSDLFGSASRGAFANVFRGFDNDFFFPLAAGSVEAPRRQQSQQRQQQQQQQQSSVFFF